ncbi:MAG: response regulator [Deltaproteobacteria bacterium]|nr:response regulator [Deltaproteobacteria bacterium]
MRMPHRILLVEDDAISRDALAALLVDDGYDVVAAPDGLDALAAAARARPDLVVTDFQMPRMDAPALVARLRADPTTRAVPIIALSVDPWTAPMRAATRADVYLDKPLDVAALSACIRSQFDRRR